MKELQTKQDVTEKPEGLRERKRRETLQRISDAALELFLNKGFDATTLDEIAEAAGISRRTFFYYFASKDDILTAYLGRRTDELRAAVLQSSSAGEPIDVVCNALLKLASKFGDRKTIATAGLVSGSEFLGTRAQSRYQTFEQGVADALFEIWPKKDRRDGLRLVAMVSIGALRLGVDRWLEHGGKRPLAKYIEDAFRNLKAEI
ncbi:TetR/AcrR family transcriptional regulator [Rhodopseudomonas palustris]|uniref:TetR/AcrR family transcriptional regulator n=1 Tax=Rhodopseudomonas palustris TaxID=1076 RepID=UPI0021F26FA3|nr:TetR/AcrR family transcriptional regulator [Rhodopseudomonas palustris]UYO56043.1 TetR/AcrR family transcriptional regulator [Rhodopseudomonas palustris]